MAILNLVLYLLSHHLPLLSLKDISLKLDIVLLISFINLEKTPNHYKQE